MKLGKELGKGRGVIIKNILAVVYTEYIGRKKSQLVILFNTIADLATVRMFTTTAKTL